MDTPNCQTTMPKVLPNQPVFCPWTSTAPLASSLAVRHGLKSFDQQTSSGGLKQPSLNFQHTVVNQSYPNNHQMSTNGLINMAKPSAALHYPSIQQSSSQFFHFLRLMQLFPDVHPATLHTVLILCKNDFFCAVDKLLYAKRCKQLYNSRRNLMQRCSSSTAKFSRHQPYCDTRTNSGRCDSEVSLKGNDQIAQSFAGQVVPLDASIKKMQTNMSLDGKGNESGSKAKLLEPRKILPRNRTKAKDKLLSLSTDLPSVASLQCKLPIRPLSPMTALPEDLSNPSSASEHVG